MISISNRVDAFGLLGEFLKTELAKDKLNTSEFIRQVCQSALVRNGWFEPRESKTMLEYWSQQLTTEHLNEWIADYPFDESSSKTVGLVLAGNIPMVGFHDVLATIVSGNKALIKCSNSDDVLIPTLLKELTRISPAMGETFEIAERFIKNYDAILATGSNNSARYFNEYFSTVPNVIRSNRTGVAILDGSETEEELNGLMRDCLQYFGLGCRSVTKLYLPVGYDLNKIFSASLPFAYLMDNKKYMNNYTYHKALMMMEKKNVLENELILMLEEPSLFSPVSVLYYQFYETIANLNDLIELNLDQIQCVIGHKNRPFGSGQAPELVDYADGANTLEFLSKLTLGQLSN